MRTVKVVRGVLLAKIEENRANHHSQFERAFAGFREQAIAELKRSLDLAQSGKPIRISIGLQAPEDRTADYDRVIAMLKMSVDQEIELTAQDFDRYVMDRWEWSDLWSTSNAAYLRA